MIGCKTCGAIHNIGFISTRLAGTDGVSLETAKWASVFQEEGFGCCYFAGELDGPPECCYELAEAHFTHPDIQDVFHNAFGSSTRARSVTRKIYQLKEHLKDHVYRFIESFNIDLLVPQNALTIPMNIPLGLALTEVISETGIPTIAHHHDFFWERQQFLKNSVWEYLNMAFPPHLPSIHHVVINSSAANQLSLRTGISSTIIPNVMDFDNPPPGPDKYAADIRQALKIADDELFVLQPTRVVKRKGIEHAIELVHRLGMKAKLIISHASGDEGYDYEKRVREYSDLLGVKTLFVSDIINERRGMTPDGRKIYTLYDIYPYADLITYPSTFEGFGNAFLEAVYFSKPIVVNAYSIYTMDIQPKGFSAVELNGYVSDEAVQQARNLLQNPDECRRITRQNYNIARMHYSYKVLKKKLTTLLSESIKCSAGEITGRTG